MRTGEISLIWTEGAVALFITAQHQLRNTYIYIPDTFLVNRTEQEVRTGSDSILIRSRHRRRARLQMAVCCSILCTAAFAVF